jgi:WD40 repeat protein
MAAAFLIASADKTARLWDRDGRPLATIQGHADRVNSAVFAPDGRPHLLR